MGKHIYKYLFFFSVIGLTACGGSETDSTSVDGDGSTSSSILTQDVIKTVWLTDAKVELQGSVVSSNENAELTLSKVTSVEGNASQCDNVKIDEDALSFTVENARDTGVCVYAYTVKSSENVSATGTSVVSLVDEQSAQVTSSPVMSNVSLHLGDTQDISLNVPAGMTLSNEISVVGSGTLTDIDLTDTAITYQAGSLSSDVGVSKIYYYSYDDDSQQLGVVNITVSDSTGDQTNEIPEATNFSYATATDMADGLTHTSVAMGDKITIDLTGYAVDPDSSSIQLVQVQSFNANVESSSPTDMNNLSFDFSSNSTGLFDVSYTVADHKGGFATGIVQIKVVGPYLDTIIASTGDVFAAPLTYNALVDAGLQFSSTAAEDDTPLGNGVKDVPLYTWAQADLICRARGGTLPSEGQWIDFEAQEGNPFLDDTILDSGSLNWPIKHSYFSSNTVDGDTTKVRVYNPVTRDFSDASKTSEAYLACVDYTPKSLDIDPLIYLVKGFEEQLSLTFTTLGGVSFPYTKQVFWDFGAPSNSSLDDVNDPTNVTTLSQDGKVLVNDEGWLNISAVAAVDSTLSSNLDFYATDNIFNVGGGDLFFDADNNDLSGSCEETSIVGDGSVVTESGLQVKITTTGVLKRVDNCTHDFTAGSDTFYHFFPVEDSTANSQVSMVMPNEFKYKLTPGLYRITYDVKFSDTDTNSTNTRVKVFSGGNSYNCSLNNDGTSTSPNYSASLQSNGWYKVTCDFTVLVDDIADYRLSITGTNIATDTDLTDFWIDNLVLLPNR